MKRKTLCILLALGMAAALSACGSQAQNEERSSSQPSQAVSAPDSSEAAQTRYDGYVFAAPNGRVVAIDEDMAQVLDDIGSPQSYFEAPSCAFEGLDKTYTYSGFIIITRPESVDLVTSITLTDDSVATPEGIYIGCPAADVIAAYGAAAETETLLSYQKGNTTLNFILADGAVISIEYLQA